MQLGPVEISKLEANGNNIYEAVAVTAKRAKEINDLYKIEFNNKISNIPKSRVDEDGDELMNHDQVRISLEFEKKLKPHQLALEEMLQGKIKYRFARPKHGHHHSK
ncbi:MAG TPA: DNA-directed RNA polymerase subunit omega [Ignavibacteriales bacterium]|jgi:DNA-directed RNA polymerase subunit K/omega|nr:DNA-directed RNA polymerase subunit omega [Ignavibacteriales bacterium]